MPVKDLLQKLYKFRLDSLFSTVSRMLIAEKRFRRDATCILPDFFLGVDYFNSELPRYIKLLTNNQALLQEMRF